MEPFEVIFRARRKDTGEWVEGSYHHNIRKGNFHAIMERDSNEHYIVYRESLQIMGHDKKWVDIDRTWIVSDD